MDLPNFWNSVSRLAFLILIPIVMVLSAVRLLMTESFITIEYGLPGFPPDPFGLSEQDRLRWAPVALEYLLNDEGIEFLGDLQFEDGTGLYNQRELRHMQDVKQLTITVLRIWRWGLILLGVMSLGVFAAQGAQTLFSYLSDASRLALIIMGVLGIGVTIAFSVLFVGFHQIFFEGSTWLFPISDTLIRLFPVRFWRDAFIFIALGTALQGGIILLISRLALSRR
jgi:integral membrane protein (TIGR01906 family)